MSRIVPVVLSGGAGARLWPLSRQARPKQFLKLMGPDSLIVSTAQRVADTDRFHPPLFVCNVEHRFIVAEQLKAARLDVGDILLEPEACNTAAAIAVAAAYVRDRYGDATMVVLPSDHLIGKPSAFLDAIFAAQRIAESGGIATLGVTPTAPETGYGYIEAEETAGSGTSTYGIRRFCEKPDRETAAAFVASGRYLWNAGIFVMRSSAALAAFDAASPGMTEAAAAAVDGAVRDMDFVRLAPAAYQALPVGSFDKLVMEGVDNGFVLPVDMEWSDIGSWDAVWRHAPHDADDNAIVGDAMLMDSDNCLAYVESGMLAMTGVSGLAVVVTDDSVLVADRRAATSVADVVSVLKKKDRQETQVSKMVYRPWGFYQDIDQGSGFRVKRITVKPGGQLSLQMHHHRSEHWVVVSGTASVVKGEVEQLLYANQSIYIPAGEKHRLENRSADELELIEVQTGDYLEEDDIVRFEDLYGRLDDDDAKSS
jgi:mannose-1-phosphate guanylyltransferase/mannose-6-phosphate isomerase